MYTKGLVVLCFLICWCAHTPTYLLAVSQNTPITTLYLVRHGQTDWNAQHKLQGRKDLPLNEKGRMEAEALCQRMHDIPIHLCLSSDLKRAAETARILCDNRKLPIRVDARLRERDVGKWEGCSTLTFSEAMVAGKQLSQIESDAKIQKRVFSCLRENISRYPGKTILVVTHGGVLKSLLGYFLHLPPSLLYASTIQNVAVIQLQEVDGQYTITRMEGIEIPSNLEKSRL